MNTSVPWEIVLAGPSSSHNLPCQVDAARAREAVLLIRSAVESCHYETTHRIPRQAARPFHADHQLLALDRAAKYSLHDSRAPRRPSGHGDLRHHRACRRARHCPRAQHLVRRRLAHPGHTDWMGHADSRRAFPFSSARSHAADLGGHAIRALLLYLSGDSFCPRPLPFLPRLHRALPPRIAVTHSAIATGDQATELVPEIGAACAEYQNSACRNLSC